MAIDCRTVGISCCSIVLIVLASTAACGHLFACQSVLEYCLLVLQCAPEAQVQVLMTVVLRTYSFAILNLREVVRVQLIVLIVVSLIPLRV